MPEIYEVGVHLSAVDGVSGVLAALSKGVLGLHGNVKELQDGFASLKLGILGAAGIAGGAELLHIAGHFEEAGEKLIHARTVFAAGLPEMTRAAMETQAAAAAWAETGRNMNTTVTGNIEAIHDLFNIVPKMDDAIRMLPAYNIMANTLQSVKDRGSIGEAASGKSAASAVRAFELEGKTNTDDVIRMSEALTKTFVALRGQVDGSQYLQAIQGAGDARQMYGEKFATEGLPVLMNIMKGRTGNLLSTLDRNLYSGVNNSNLQGMFQEKYGLHTEDDRLLDEKGHWTRGAYKVGTVFEAAELRNDPLQWSQDYRKHLSGMGVDTNDVSTMTEIAESIGRGNKTLASLLGELLSPKTSQSIQRELTRRETVPDDAAKYLHDNDPAAVRAAMWKQYENATEGIGQHLVQPMMENVIKPLTVALSSVAEWANVHPEAIKRIGEAMAIIGVGMIALGTAAVVTAAALLIPGGAVTLAIAGIASAVTLLAAIKWDTVSAALTKAGDTLGLSWANFDKNTAKMAADWSRQNDRAAQMIADIVGLGAKIGDAFLGLWNGLIAKLRAIPGVSSLLGVDSARAAELAPGASIQRFETDRGDRARTSDYRYINREAGLDFAGIPAWQREAFGPQLPVNDNKLIPGFKDDRSTRARPEDAVTPSFWHRIFGGVGEVPLPRSLPGTPPTVPTIQEDRATRATGSDVQPLSWFHRTFGQAGDTAALAGTKLGALNTSTGIVLTAFDGLNTRSGAVSTGFTDLGTRSGGLTGLFGNLAQAIQAVTDKLNTLAGVGGGEMPGIGGSGGITNAAYTTFGDDGGGVGGGAAPSIRYGRQHGSGLGLPGIGSAGGSFAPGAPAGAVDVASRMLGMSEIGNRGQVNSFLNSHGSHIDAARTAWCAAFVNSALDAVGIRGTGNLAASSFGHWGKGVDLGHIMKGDVLVKSHHVGLATGEVDASGRIGMISGNHGNRVGHSWESPGSILGARRAFSTPGQPPAVAGPPPRKVTPGKPAGASQPQMIQARIEVPVHIGNDKVAHHVVHRMVAAMDHPTAVGGPDTYGSWQGPATPLNDAA